MPHLPRRDLGCWVVMILCLTRIDSASATSCANTLQRNFIGQVCFISGGETDSGQWILEEGGVFSGQITLQTTTSSRTITKTGRLATRTFQGTLTSTASNDTIVFKLHEVRKGVETLADGSVFSGDQTLDVTGRASSSSGSSGSSGSDGGSTPMTTAFSKKGGLATYIFSGKLNVTTTHSMQPDGTVLSSSQTTTMNGVWTITPTEKLKGTLTISFLNGVKTVTDSRVPTT